mmetsp:Transcript_12906/g.30024  ORF Transcript_12906/g.30024 Transcript_12906/m.30024 type:complete len:356 (-) Transcript_12906:248-1315(-)
MRPSVVSNVVKDADNLANKCRVGAAALWGEKVRVHELVGSRRGVCLDRHYSPPHVWELVNSVRDDLDDVLPRGGGLVAHQQVIAVPKVGRSEEEARSVEVDGQQVVPTSRRGGRGVPSGGGALMEVFVQKRSLYVDRLHRGARGKVGPERGDLEGRGAVDGHDNLRTLCVCTRRPFQLDIGGESDKHLVEGTGVGRLLADLGEDDGGRVDLEGGRVARHRHKVAKVGHGRVNVATRVDQRALVHRVLKLAGGGVGADQGAHFKLVRRQVGPHNGRHDRLCNRLPAARPRCGLGLDLDRQRGLCLHSCEGGVAHADADVHLGARRRLGVGLDLERQRVPRTITRPGGEGGGVDHLG